METLFWRLLWERGNHVGLFTRPVDRLLWSRTGEMMRPFWTPEGRLFFKRGSLEWDDLARVPTNLYSLLSRWCRDHQDIQDLGWELIYTIRNPNPFSDQACFMRGSMGRILTQKGRPVGFTIRPGLRPHVIQHALSLAGVLTTSVMLP